MATYNQIRNSITKGDDEQKRFLEQQDAATQKAWAVFNVLSGRKGFDWWFQELDTSIKNDIFNAVRKVLS